MGPGGLVLKNWMSASEFVTRKGYRVQRVYRCFCKKPDTRFRVTEFLWNTVRPTLPKKKKKAQGPSAEVLSLDDTVLPEAHLETLGLGPKFCFEPTLGPPDILAVARSVTEMVPEEERGRCVAEGAGVVNELEERRGRRCKGMIPVAKNLKKVKEKPGDVKKKAIALMEKLNLDKLCTAVRDSAEVCVDCAEMPDACERDMCDIRQGKKKQK
ncbi:hypothetical protein HPB50_007855 [Hyalomma asiaticum]|uniref:Uncharacterized protein n=1 Tax=Hyalomma asiaticum TaxID=266040 RepID=A0ACB7T8E8_HYAAI|nr:hypothetical protein HPB50_007855 [Hyalomma asiaticum]